MKTLRRLSMARAAGRALLAAALVAGPCDMVPALADEATPAQDAQQDFASAAAAVNAFIAAVRGNLQQDLARILGPGGEKLIHSGDAIADREGRNRLIRAYDTAHRIRIDNDSAALIVGAEQWSLPIPLVHQGGRWRFDTEASAQKIIDRRVGRNELNVIQVCRAYVDAQREYASQRQAGGGQREFASRFESTVGQHDGLYWDAAPGQPQSPLGPLVAKARAEGYDAAADKERGEHPSPYHGYFYRILTSQGPHAPGGAKDYLADGHMTGGFALLAFPARWGDSGIMTFMVNQDGIVFQRNLGPQTEELARDITQFEPDLSWTTP